MTENMVPKCRVLHPNCTHLVFMLESKQIQSPLFTFSSTIARFLLTSLLSFAVADP